MKAVEMMKKTAMAFFIVGGWTFIVSVVGYACAFGVISVGLLPYWTWTSLPYGIPALGFIVGVLHFRAILRSA